MMDCKPCFILLFIFASLVVAQQQNQDAAPSPPVSVTCNTTTTKPIPQTNTYQHEQCVVAKFAAYLSVGPGQYIELNDGKVSNSSRCEKTTNGTEESPRLVVDFDCGQLMFQISRSNDSKIFIETINGNYRVGNADITFSNGSAPLFVTSESGHYYKCNAEQSVNLNSPAPGQRRLVISNFAYEAYRTASGSEFYKIVEECPLDVGQVSDLVRIGVGICLVSLVVIVLIAYFVGRRRWSERSSYESV